ncbi:MAG: disulfide bond formation protein B [Halioglobus sp.]|nr:disulfide bond formation protein B [Halioglobus sp.]
MPHTLSQRQVFCALVLLAVVAMLFARVYLQAYLGLEACPLCMTQRLFVVIWGVIALLGALHNPGALGGRVYAGLCALSAYAGALVAARHVWLQHLPADQVPACGPPLDYLLENFPLRDAINTLLMGDGNCADTVWTFLGLSIPEQTLLVFLVALFIASWQALRGAR